MVACCSWNSAVVRRRRSASVDSKSAAAGRGLGALLLVERLGLLPVGGGVTLRGLAGLRGRSPGVLEHRLGLGLHVAQVLLGVLLGLGTHLDGRLLGLLGSLLGLGPRLVPHGRRLLLRQRQDPAHSLAEVLEGGRPGGCRLGGRDGLCLLRGRALEVLDALLGLVELLEETADGAVDFGRFVAAEGEGEGRLVLRARRAHRSLLVRGSWGLYVRDCQGFDHSG